MKQYLITVLVVVLVITFSFLLIPRKAELGLIYKKGRQFDLAKFELKKQASKGDLSISVTIPLMELYLHFGEIAQAVDLIERFVEENPQDISIRDMLGNLYKDGMIPQKYISNLEKSAVLEPTEKRLRELIHQHQTHGTQEKVLEYLKLLVQQFPDNPREQYDLAFLQAKLGNPADALNTLEAFEKEYPQSVSIDIKALQVHMFLNQSKYDRAQEEASNWLAQNFSPSSLARLVQLFRSKNQKAQAFQLMKRFYSFYQETPQEKRNSPNLQVERKSYKASLSEKGRGFQKEAVINFLRDEYYDLQFQILSKKEALAKMRELSRQKKLPDSLMKEYIDLAIELKDHPLLFKIALETPVEKVDKNLLIHLAEIALSAEVGDSMKKVLDRFGEEFLSSRPLLGARLMDRLKDRESTLQWLKKVEAQENLPLERQIELNQFYEKLGVRDKAKYKKATLAKMTGLLKQEKLPNALLKEYIDLALESREYLLLFEMALEAAPGKVDEELLLHLAEIALSEEVGDQMKKVLARFGEDFLRTRPLLAARLMDRLDDRESTLLWLKKVETLPNLSLERQIELHQIYEKLGISDRTKNKKNILAKLKKKFNQQQLPDSLKKEYIDLALDLKEYSLLFDIALGTTPETVEKELLLNLAEVALHQEFGDSMKLVLARFGEEFLLTRPLLGAQLMDRLNDKESALRWLKKAEAQPSQLLERKIELIHFYNKLGVPNRAKEKLDVNGLKNLIAAKLSQPGLLLPKKKELIQVLIQLDGFQRALPYLENLAAAEGGEWDFHYENALKRLNRKKQLVGYWEKKITGTKLNRDEKRNIIFQLLENNLKADAVRLLKILAKNAAPQSPEVLQLLYIWGPKVKSEDLEWLISKAKESTGKNLAGWMKHLIQSGAAQEAMAIAKNEEFSDPVLFETYLQALEALENKRVVNAEMIKHIPSDNNANNLFLYGKLAEDLELYETALIAFEKALDRNPGDDKTIQKLGFVNYYLKNWRKAEFYLEEALHRKNNDWKTPYYYAEAIHSQGKKSKAETYYSQALEKIQQAPMGPFDLQLAKATCFLRLGRKKQALLAYENLLNENPNNKIVRVNLITALMDLREFDRARVLLESQ